MSKQSSIDWLISQYKKQGFFYDLDIEAAKAMHKQEIEDAIGLAGLGLVKTQRITQVKIVTGITPKNLSNEK